MRSLLLSALLLTAMLSISNNTFAQNENFTQTTVKCAMAQPWELTYGPDNFLWITEARSYKLQRVNPATGASTVVLDANSQRNFPYEQYPAPQGGFTGLALHPQLLTGKPYIYLAFVYQFNGCQLPSGFCNFKTKIIRYDYNPATFSVSNPQVLVDTIPGSDDHNGGRLTIGEVGGVPYLFYSVGDMGAGQFANANRPHNGQNTNSYEGKILRFNLEPDADANAFDKWIPASNPFNTAGQQSAVWSIGHRNPQGLVFGSNGLLYETEHGPYSDDELNIIQPGKNYGFPLIVGMNDGNYNGIKVGTGPTVPVINEQASATALGANYVNPIFSYFPVPLSVVQPIYNNQVAGTDPYPNYFLSWPSIAPSGIGFYSSSAIPGWQNSILVASLKRATVYRMKLSANGQSVVGDTIPYFRGQGRFRDIAISPDGNTIYVACDSLGNTSGPTNGTTTVPINKGCILAFTYSPSSGGSDLSVTTTTPSLTVPQWSNFSTVFKVQNTGTSSVSGVTLSIPLVAGMVFQGGNEYTASQGTYSTSGSNVWSVGTLAAGATATITINYFLTSNAPLSIVATLTASSPADPNAANNSATVAVNGGGSNPCSPDVTPPVLTACPANISVTTAGTSATATWTAPTATDACPGTVLVTTTNTIGSSFPLGTTTVTYTAKDAANNTSTCSFTVTVTQTTTNQPDLTLSNLNISGTSVPVGAILNFNFDLKNIGTAAATGNFNIKSYLSTDNVLSANDIQNGNVPTGNLGAGQTVLQVPGALTVPAGTATGNYFVILKVDADNQITESNENNNVLASAAAIAVTSGGGNMPNDLSVTTTTPGVTVPQWSNFSAVFKVQNIGTSSVSGVTLSIPLVTGMVFQGGNEYTASQGTYSTSGSNVWSVGTLAAGAAATITINYFLTSNAPLSIAASLTASSPADPNAANNSATVAVNGGGSNPCSPDVTPPVLTACPANISLTTAGTSTTATWTAPTATDACPGTVLVTTTNAIGSSFPLGTTTVTYTAKDAANNTSTCSFTVTVTQTGGVCSFVKSYLENDLNAGFNDRNNIVQTANGLELTYFDAAYSASSAKTIKTDAGGNYISTVTTPLTAAQNINSYNSVRTAAGDFVAVDAGLNLPIFRKVNAAGTTVWSTTISQYIPTIANGAFSYAGIIAEGTGFIGAFTLSDGTTSPQFGELILIKVDANGNFLWQKKHALGVSYPIINLLEISTDALYATASKTDGNYLFKFNKTNGNIIWSSLISSNFYGFSDGNLTSDGGFAVLYSENSFSNVKRFNATTGAVQGTVNLSTFYSPVPAASFPRGLTATNDGGIVISGGFNGAFSSDPNINYKYLKINASLGLVWSKSFSPGWNFAPKAVASDGGLLFLGNKGLDMAILKTTAAGDITPQCANSCYLTTATVSNVVCNNSGTDANPLDDTYSFGVIITNSGGCAGGWTGAGTTGAYNTVKTISGLLVEDGIKTLQFADAGNPGSSVFTIKVNPSGFCSNTPAGCGYETSSASFGTGFNKFENTTNGSIKASISEFTSGANAITSYRETNLDANGAIGTSLNHIITLPSQYQPVHTPDGNFVYTESLLNNIITLKKVTPAGGIIWTKSVAFTVPASAISSATFVAAVNSNGIYINAAYDTQAAPNIAPVHFPFIVKCDLNGIKLSQSALPSWSYSDYQAQTFRFEGADGSYYHEVFRGGIGWHLVKTSAGGVLLWDVNLLGDPPSSSLKRIELNPAGTAVFVTAYSNSSSYITKYNTTTGATMWSKDFRTAFGTAIAPDNFLEMSNVRNAAVTADGGIVAAFDYQDFTDITAVSGYAYVRLSPNGTLIYAKKNVNIGSLAPAVGTPDGGMVFSGIKVSGGNWTFLKINSLGEPTPPCNNSTPLPDLTLANLNVQGTSVPVGAILNFNFDLKNIGTAAATGNFNIKSYLSTDNVLSANDIQNGNVPTGNLGAGQTVLQVPGALTVPTGTATGNYFVILKVDADNQITESNENNNVIVSAATVAVTTNGGAGADLEITMTADKTIVPQWGYVTYTITAKNNGNATIASAIVRFEICGLATGNTFVQVNQLVYASTPPTATSGSYNQLSQLWTLSNLAAGQTGVLTVQLFTLGTSQRKVVAFSKTQSPADPDSQPSTTAPVNCAPVQDDEAVWTINVGSPLMADMPAALRLTDFTLFPNPTSASVAVRMHLTDLPFRMAIYNQIGQELKSFNFDGNANGDFELDIDHLEDGIYFVKMSMTDQPTVVRTLVIDRMR